LTTTGTTIVRVKDIPWEDRINVDNWPSRAGLYYDNRDLELCIRLIDYPVGSIEPRHVHAGMHATTVLKGRAIIDGLTLESLDVIIGPSNEPHGPLEYPDGCILLSAFQGSYFHSEVETLAREKQYRLVQHDMLPWQPLDGGGEIKTLVDRGLGRLLLEAYRFAPGATFTPGFLAALVVNGAPQVGDQTLGTWDFVYRDEGAGADVMSFPNGGTLLAVTMR
jgi:quercetin dioxygenase-like cupin family protein